MRYLWHVPERLPILQIGDAVVRQIEREQRAHSVESGRRQLGQIVVRDHQRLQHGLHAVEGVVFDARNVVIGQVELLHVQSVEEARAEVVQLRAAHGELLDKAELRLIVAKHGNGLVGGMIGAVQYDAAVAILAFAIGVDRLVGGAGGGRRHRRRHDQRGEQHAAERTPPYVTHRRRRRSRSLSLSHALLSLPPSENTTAQHARPARSTITAARIRLKLANPGRDPRLSLSNKNAQLYEPPGRQTCTRNDRQRSRPPIRALNRMTRVCLFVRRRGEQEEDDGGSGSG